VAEAMTSFTRQRWMGLGMLVAFGAWAMAEHAKYAGVMPRLSYVSGWVLFAVMLVLTAYNGRKKLPFLPLGSSESWLQFHIYAGLLTVILFAIHISYKMPTGWFQGTLAWLYVLVTLSGVWGLFVSRSIPKRLTTRGGEILYERIPAIRRGFQQQAEALALQSVSEARSPTIANFYITQLKDFFERPQNLSLHFLEVRRPLNLLLNKISDLNRYSDAKERETLEKIAELVRQKDGLDYHHALQLSLRGWLFVHIPLTYSLLIFSIVHIILVYAFSGGAR
jgi:hypothetical protein